MVRATLKIGLAWLVFFALLALFVWFAGPSLIRDAINRRGQTFPDYVLHVDRVSVNPIAASASLYGVSMVKRKGEIPVPFFQGPDIFVGLQWREILHGDFRSNIELTQPEVNFVQGPTAAQTQLSVDPAWVDFIRQLKPLKINRVQIKDGLIHFYDFHSTPQVDLLMDQMELVVDNLTNSARVKTGYPSTISLTGRPLKRGRLEAHLAADTEKKTPTFKQQIRLENIPAPALNSILAKYGSIYAKSGNLNFYTEMVSKDGKFSGYAKPFFQDIEFEPMPKDREGVASLWAGLVNGVKDIFQDRRQVLATEVPIAGTYSDPKIGIIPAAFGAFKNAYFSSLAVGFHTPQLAPSPTWEEDKKIHAVIRSDPSLNPPSERAKKE